MNPLAIRIAANLAEFKANMAEMKGQLETTASSMKRMSSAFDGSKIIGDANAMVAAIGGVAGASKLTDAEMRRVNATTTEAIEKYKRLGREAPPEMIALRDATAKVNVESAKTPSLMDQASSKISALGVAAGTFLGNMAWSAVNKLGSELGEFAKQGMQLQGIESSFQSLARGVKANASEMLAGMQKASRGLVSEFDLMKAANKAMLLGLPVTSESMGTLANAATTLGRAMGQDATKSVDDLITALGRSSPMILDNLGLTVKVGEANEAYARKLGKTAEQLTDAEKKTAFYVAAMEAAKNKTKELDSNTTTLGETLKRVWTWVGDNVTRTISEANVGFGDLVVMVQNFDQVFKKFMDEGAGAALRLTGELGRFKNAIFELTDAQKKEVDQLLKNGIPANQLYDKSLGQNEASVLAYVNSLKKAPPAVVELTEAQKRAIEEAKKFAEAVEKQKDKINGVVKPTKEWAEAIKQLGMALQSLPKGPGTAVGFFDSLPAANDGIRVFNQTLPTATSNLQTFFDTLRNGNDAFQNIFGSPENLQRLPQAMFDLTTGEWIPAAGDKAGKGFSSAFGDSLKGMGDVIMGAMQGGGDVGKAMGAKLGLDLGNSLAETLGPLLQNALGKSLGGMLGGLLGPLGALGGSLLGGLAGKLGDALGLGNKGRDNAKAFAESFGGFDALREKMLQLEGGGESLWIALTQNTKGPKQVAETIAQIEAAFRKAEEAANKTGDSIEDAFEGPEGARGFPTKEQLNKAASDAEETWRYIKDSGKYNAAQVDQAWQQWQDALVAAGDTSILKIRELDKEIKGLQDAIAMEPPEFDAEGNRIYGVEEWNNIQKLQALEAERAAQTKEAIGEEKALREGAAVEGQAILAQTIAEEQALREGAAVAGQAIISSGIEAEQALRKASAEEMATMQAGIAVEGQQMAIQLVEDQIDAEKSLRSAAALDLLGMQAETAEDGAAAWTAAYETAATDTAAMQKQISEDMTDVTVGEIKKKMTAEAESAKQASASANTEFNKAKDRAKDLDSYLADLFRNGYEIPIRFRVPGEPPPPPGESSVTSLFGAATRGVTSSSTRTSMAAPVNVTVISQLDGREVARNQVRYIPRELDFIGARR